MTVYGPDITEAFEVYATQFDDLLVQEREPIIDLNAINPLSELRENWQNVTTDPTEHHLSTSSGVNEIAYLETEARGQYTAGYQAQAGIGVRIPSNPTQDGVMRWGYYTTDANEEPVDGWYFGVDSEGIFVCEVRNGNKDKVYQDSWNVDRANGSENADTNPSDYNLDLSKGHIFQLEFVYYGYGPAKMEVLTDDGKVTLHKFTHDGQTSVTNTNLPINAQIDNVSTASDANELFVGGRQFSIVGQKTTNERNASHYRQSSQTVDSTQWHPLISIKIKDGTDIGSIDFSHILARIDGFELDADNTAYRWQIRRGVSLDAPVWETPESHSTKQDETIMKVDTSSTSIGADGSLTGVYVDGGTISAGSNNESNVVGDETAGEVVNGVVVTFAARATAGASGTLSEIQFKWREHW